MSKRKALGKGVAALIPTRAHSEEEEATGEGAIRQIDINAIDTNPYQPRIDFDDGEITALAASIEAQGLLQPVVLREKGDRYEIISGERRFRAFKHLKRDTVPCVVKTDTTDREMLELALVENIQREDLNEIEKALAYRKLTEEFSYTHEEIAKQMGKSRTVITNSLRLLNLPEEIQQMVRKNEITSGHARAILSIEGEEKQLEAARKILEDGLTVRDIEYITQQEKSTPPKPSAPKPQKQPPQDPDITHVLERLQYKFGTSVKLKTTGDNRGRVEIEYFSEEDMARIFGILLVDGNGVLT
ncbi:MAG: ParB/RepB/Spo0J family partition protein [Chitinispirillales bacterium]|jgi:ParB family chromosome partitioning protein|nr:ParB/RepB/Spo0J family partition protein [Chitinispirillales bacterium]